MGFIRLMRRVPIVFLLVFTGVAPLPANALEVLFGTGETGSFSHFAGRTICRMINRQTDALDCTVVPGPGDVHNLTNLQGGSLDIALVDSRMLHDALDKKGYFEFLDIRYDSLLAVSPLYHVPITLVARRDANISSVDTLKGKRINAGAPRSASHLAVETILAAKNWTKRDFALFEELPASQSQDTMAFCHGTIQAMVHIGVHPDASLNQLMRLCRAALVNMDDGDIAKLVRDHPAFSTIAIPAETYTNQPAGVTTFGTTVILVASKSLDSETVFMIIEALDRRRRALEGAHPAFSAFSVKGAGNIDLDMELHPAVAEYLSAHGN
jgi:TRAP transporter TAXI family solute receptor